MVVSAETPTQKGQRVYRVVRENGALRLEYAEDFADNSMSGRLIGLFPARPPSPTEQALARTLVESSVPPEVIQHMAANAGDPSRRAQT